MNLRSACLSPGASCIGQIFPNPQTQNPGRAAWMPQALRRSLALCIVVLMVPMAGVDLFAQQAPETYPQQDEGPPPPAYPGYQQQAPGYGENSAPPYGTNYGAPPAPESQPEYAPAPQQPQGLSPDQLEQLVAPIALYPDALLAQVLAASTYPAQVADADHWRQAQMGAPPEQIAYEANLEPWDPSVKALTAFPQVLAELDQNLQWTTELGNAYYNQPQDVFAAVQDLRRRAEAAGTLQNTPQETLSYDQGYIALAPATPQIVYVPAYNPWTVYGSPIAPYPGFSLLGALGSFLGPAVHYGMGMVMTAFMPMRWGWLGWGLSWIGHLLTFQQQGYYSHSTTLADWGLPYGGPRVAWRGGYGSGYEAARGADGYGWRSSGPSNGYDRRYQPQRSAYGQQRFDQQRFADYSRRDTHDSYARGYGRTEQGLTHMPAFNARPQYAANTRGQYGRPAGYGSAWNDSVRRNWSGGARDRASWAGAPTASRSYAWSQPQRSGAAQYRAYARAPRSAFGDSGYRNSAFRHENFNARSSREFSGYSRKSERSSSFRGFRGGHESRSFGRSGHFKAPKESRHGGGHGGQHKW
jgi:hypothetical protein